MSALSPRQQQVLRLLVLTGASNEELAKMLGTTPRTVKFHIGALIKALGVGSRAKIQALALSRVVSMLAEVQGKAMPSTNDGEHTLEISTFLSELFDDADCPIGQALAEPLHPGDLKDKR